MKKILWKILFAMISMLMFLQTAAAEELSVQENTEREGTPVPYSYAGMEAGTILDLGTGLYIYEYGKNSVTIEYQGRTSPAMLMELFLHGERVFCIEPEIYTKEGEGYSPGVIDHVLSAEEQRRLGLIAYYGYGYQHDASAEMSAATIVAVWMERGRKVSDVKESVMEKVRVIQDRVARADIQPSFAKETLTLTGYGKEHAVTLTDHNNVLTDYHVYDDGGYHIEKKGDTLTIWLDAGRQTEGSIILDRIPRESQGTSVVYVNAQDRQKLMRIYPQDAESIQLNVKMAPASLRICKQNEDGRPVAGAVFALSYQEDMSDRIGTFETDASGYVEIPQLLPRPVYIKEIFVPEPYILDETVEKAELHANDTVVYTKVNYVKKGTLRIFKTDEKGNGIAGVAFEIASDREFLTILGSGMTDERGYLSFTGLRYGTYYVREKTTGESFVLDEAIHDIIVGKDFEELSIVNRLRLSSIKVYKYDQETGQPLAGVEFTLYDAFGDILDVQKTDACGIAIFENLKNGTYYIKETGPLAGYYPLNEPLSVVIAGNDEGRVYEYELVNKPIVHTGVHDDPMPYKMGCLLSSGVLCALHKTKRRKKKEM